MARHHTIERPTEPAIETSEVRGTDANPVNLLARVLALVAAAVPTVIGFIALARIDWTTQGMDAPAVAVAGMSFRPWVAIATLVVGLIAVLAAATSDRESKLVIGALLACGGVAIVVVNPKVQQVALSDRMGWMYVLVGAVLVVAGLLAGQTWSTRRQVQRTSV